MDFDFQERGTVANIRAKKWSTSLTSKINLKLRTQEAHAHSEQPSTHRWRNIAKSLSDPVPRNSAHVVSLLDDNRSDYQCTSNLGRFQWRQTLTTRNVKQTTAPRTVMRRG